MSNTKQTETAAPEDNKGQMIEVKDIHEFVKFLSAWHQQRVLELQHMLKLPEGVTLECDGKDMALTGDLLAGFKSGVDFALMRLGTLPFAAELEEAPVH